MDILALQENSALDDHGTLESYQLAILTIVVVEILGLLLNTVLAFVPLFSHYKNTTCKMCFNDYYFIFFKYIICGLLFKQISRKEARVWLFLSSSITQVIAVSSHAGFVVGGWVAYEDRSIAIFLLYLFIFVFLYWSLQYIYRFSNVVINFCRKRIKRNLNDYIYHCDIVDVDIERGNDHHEEELSNTLSITKFVGFDTIALFFMFVIIIFVYGIIAFFGFGLVVPLLSSLDEALVHIYRLGKYAFVVIVFLLTYKLFTITSGGVPQRLISNDGLRYLRFLNSRGPPCNAIIAPQCSMKLLHLTLNAFKPKDRAMYRTLLRKKQFDLKVTAGKLNKAAMLFEQQEEQDALEPTPTDQSVIKICSHRQAAERKSYKY